MNKSVGIIAVGLCLISGLIYFATRPTGTVATPVTTNKTSQNAVSAESSSQARPQTAKTWTRAKPGDASLGNDPRNEVVTQQGDDFNTGDMQNVAMTDGMQMGYDRTFICRMNPNYKLFGVYMSQEQFASQPFDTIIPTMDVTPGKESQVTLEVRTRAVDSDWTTWEEIGQEKLNQPLDLGTTAVVWQYRLTFLGNDPATSTKVKRVAIATRKSGNASSNASPNTLSANGGQ